MAAYPAVPSRPISPEPATARLFRSILSVQPHYVLLIGLLPGFALLFFSIALGISSFTASAPAFAPVNRAVGYFSAINWSITYALLLPLSLYLMTTSLQGIADALDRMHSRGMVRDSNMRIVTAPLVTESWIEGTRIRSGLLTLFAISLPGLYAVIEWFLNNLLRLLGSGPPTSAEDFDWGLAAIMANWSLGGRLSNAGFDLLAFCDEFFLLASSFAFFLLLLDLGRILPSRAQGSPYILVPDLNAVAEPRRGFEEFSNPLQEMLGVALLGYLMCYCVRLEGLYMRSPKATSLADFVQSDVWAGVGHASDPAKGATLTDILRNLTTLGDYTTRGMLAWLLAVLIFAFSLIVVVMSVRGAAIRAKANAITHLTSIAPSPIFGKTIAEELDWAKAMNVWPLQYLKLNWILLTMFFAVVTLYFYRVGLFIAGFVIATLILRLVARITKQS